MSEGGQGQHQSWRASSAQRGSGPRLCTEESPCMVRSKALWVMVTWDTPCGQTHRHNWKHYLPTTSLARGKKGCQQGISKDNPVSKCIRALGVNFLQTKSRLHLLMYARNRIFCYLFIYSVNYHSNCCGTNCYWACPFINMTLNNKYLL